jgi:cell division protein FtsL
MNIILGIILIVLVLFCIYLVYRLNLYIASLETKIQNQEILAQNLMQSLKDVIAEDALGNDGRLKKFRVQNERNFIYNGVAKVEEDKYEL